jgi:hypothetical protein
MAIRLDSMATMPSCMVCCMCCMSAWLIWPPVWLLGMLPEAPEGMAGEEPLVWARAGATTSAAAKPPRRARRFIKISC